MSIEINQRSLADLSAEMVFRGRLQNLWLKHAHPQDPAQCPLCCAEMTVEELERHGPDCPEADLKHVTFEVFEVMKP